MSRYLPSIKQHAWIALACMLLAAVGAVFVARAIPAGYVVSSTVLVQIPSSSSGDATSSASAADPAKSLSAATTYAAIVPTRSVMQYVYAHYPDIGRRHYSVEALMQDTTASASTTASTIDIQVTARTPADSVALANDIAIGFVGFLEQAEQQQLDMQRTAIENQLAIFEKQKSDLEAAILKNAATTTTTTNNHTSSTTTTSGSSNSTGSTNNSSIGGPGNTSSNGATSSSDSSSSRGITTGGGSSTTTTVTSPSAGLYMADLNATNQTIGALQQQLAQLPATAAGNATVVQLAARPDVAPSAKPFLIAVATVVCGLLVGVLIMLLTIFLDDRLRGDDRVKERLGLAYLGSVSTSRQLANPAEVSGEALQQAADIYTSLLLTDVLAGAGNTSRGHVLLVTSAQPAEGKTTIATMLAATVARAGSSAVLIDGDLRHPSTHLAFRMEATDKGLGALLNSACTLDGALVPTAVPGLRLLPAGPERVSSVLQLRRELPAVLAQLRDEADVVIIDGPPLLRDATATVLANMADGVMLVVDVRHDKLPLLLRSKELLGSLTRVPVGVTLNRASPRRRNAYFATVPARDSAPPQSHPRGPVPVGVATELLVPADLAVSTNHDGVSMGSEPR